jgi:hypothetical protein
MYDLNRYAKIVVDSKEVYYGCIKKIDEEIGIAELLVVDWRDRELQNTNYFSMIVPLSKFTIKYLDSDTE